jgi:hypothetical protein
MVFHRMDRKTSVTLPPWLTEHGVDMSLYPIDGILKQALSPDDEEFRSGCALLKSMCSVGRIEAGIFLLGLLKHYPDNYSRLTLIADSLALFPHSETVEAFASELRRVQGSSATRAYLRRIIDALERFPTELVDEHIQRLATDPLVGARFRQRLKSLLRGYGYE